MSLKRATFALTALCTLFALVASACGSDEEEAAPATTTAAPAAVEYTTPSGDSFTLSADTAAKLASGEKVKVLTIVNGTAIPIFGEQVRLGADRACDAGTSKYAAECQFAGPPQGDVVELVNQLEAILAAGGIDCLALQTFPPGALVDIVNREVDGGMPVFTYNVDIPDSKRFAQYALNELAAGTLVGQTTANIVVANGLDVKKIALGTGDPAGQWAQDRMEGFRAGFTEVLPDTEWHNDHLSGIQTAVNWTVQETVDTVGPFMAANPDVDLFFHTDQGVEGVGIAIRDQGRTGEVFTSGFNTSAQILDLIGGIPGYRARIRPIVSRITIHWPSFYNVVTGKTLALPNLIALQHIPLSPAGVIAKRPAPIALPNSCAAEWRMAPDAVFSPYASVRYFTPHMVHSQYNLL